MKLPEFKRKSEFLEGTDIPCLFAKVKNSMLPNVATRHISRYKKDPVCEIMVRSSNTKELSDWPKEILEDLLENEKLPAALEEGMKDYESDNHWPGYFKESRNYEEIKQFGIVPHITVEAIVVDEIKREVILVCDTQWDINLSEHGIAITFCDGRWQFNYEDYLSDYKSRVEEEETTRLWEMARIPEKSTEESETDTSFIFGIWEFDSTESEALLKRMNCSQRDIKEAEEAYGSLRYEISPSTFRQVAGSKPGQTWEYVFLGCERKGEEVTIKYRRPTREEVLLQKLFYQRELLMNLNGLVLRRKA